MATLIIASANANITAANAFNTIEAGSGATQQTRSASTTTTASYVYSSAFTGTNLDVCDGLLLYCNQTTTTGTVSVTLSEDNGVTATREVTVNATDLSTSAGWVFFKFGSSLTLDGGTDYKVGIKGSSAGNATFFRDSTAGNWTRILRLTTTATAAAGDVLYIAGDHTGAGATTTRTVTMDDTASTDYGTGVAGAADNGIEIGDAGVLTFGTSAATNYTLKVSGSINVWGNGTFSIGTTGTPIPRGSTATLTLDCGANVDFGLIVNAGGIFNSQTLSRTSGKDIYYCKLNTDEAAAQTTLGVDTDTGWLSGDVIAIASTTRTASECESRTLNANANASDMTVTAGLTNAHSGTSPTQAEVILLTRSIVIQGASASLQGYITFSNSSTADIDWTEFKWLGSATASKRGIEGIGNSTISVNIQYSSLHDFSVASSLGFSCASGNSGWTFSNNVTYNIAGVNLQNAATSGTWTADSNILMRNTSGNLVTLADIGGTFTNNTMVGGANFGLSITEAAATPGTFSGCTMHSNSSSGMNFGNNTFNGAFSTFSIWRNNASGLVFNGVVHNCTFTSFTFFGNLTGNIFLPANTPASFLKFISLTTNGDSTFSTTDGITLSSSGSGSDAHFWVFESADFSTVAGIKTAHTNDINVSAAGSATIVLRNSKMGGTNEVATQTNLLGESTIGSQKHDQTAGLHKTWKKYGTITIDTTISNTASPSERLTPNNASNKLISGVKRVAVASGFSSSPAIYIRESVVGDGTDYNGNRARLIVKRNDAVGIISDTVLATASVSSEGAFEQLVGTTAAATDNGVLEFYVDCDGTTGWVNVDDWSLS